LYQTIEKLLETVNPNEILYFSFEESSANPKEVLEFYEKRVLKKPVEEAEKTFVFFDEIQYAKNWPCARARLAISPLSKAWRLEFSFFAASTRLTFDVTGRHAFFSGDQSVYDTSYWCNIETIKTASRY